MIPLWLCILASLISLHPASAIIRDTGIDYDSSDASAGVQEVTQKAPKRYIVSNQGNKVKVHADAKVAGGKALDGFDDLGFSVIAFDNSTDSSTFASLGYKNRMEEDPPRYTMRTQGQPDAKGKYDKSNLLRLLQTDTEVVPYGISKVFQNIIPDPSYFPSKSVTKPICIIDTGFSGSTHPDLSNVVATKADSSQTSIADCPSDVHGTHVAGTIVAEDNSVGVLGIFPGASIMIVKVFGGSTCGWTYASDLVAAANKCASSGAKIITMSLGGSFSSSTESNAFATLRQQGVLSFAAAGNDGSTAFSYPASYASVISVAAIDESNNKASFSQYNSQVDIAAPGVGILSTVLANTLYFATSQNSTFLMTILDYSISPSLDITSKTCKCTTTTCPNTCSGRVCIISRGDTTFAAKATACKSQGGIAALIYNNAVGFFGGTLGSAGLVDIPIFGTSGTYGATLASLDTEVDFLIDADPQPYNIYDGTSMATPHASGTTFLLWNKFPSCTSEQISDAILNTALDLGTAGRDNSFGNGLIQYWSAASYLQQPGRCAAPPTGPTPTKPTPVKPTPIKPTPTKPTPVKPTPTKLSPTKPTPTSCVSSGGSCANGKSCCSSLTCNNKKICK